jgi:hypothetical protein
MSTRRYEKGGDEKRIISNEIATEMQDEIGDKLSREGLMKEESESWREEFLVTLCHCHLPLSLSLSP